MDKHNELFKKNTSIKYSKIKIKSQIFENLNYII